MTEYINGFEMSRDQFFTLSKKGEWCYDIETYQNYYLAMYKCEDIIVYFDSRTSFFEWIKYKYWHENITAFGFNNIFFDNPISHAYYSMKYEPIDAYNFGQDLIQRSNQMPVYKIFQSRGLRRGWDVKTAHHYDIKDVAFGMHSLKFYGAVIDAPKLQDLPYAHDKILTDSEMQDVFEYCENDIDTTILLRSKLDDAFKIREDLGLRYGLNVKSKKDAQVAEGVLLRAREIQTGRRVERPNYEDGYTFKYDIPEYISFKTDNMNQVLDEIRNADFVLRDGRVNLGVMSGKVVKIAGYEYQMGIGGLHSKESRITHKADDDTFLLDIDVASYYPSIIVRNKYCPSTYGDSFTDVYDGIIQQRLAAKKSGEKLLANGLKIPLNASFGKLGERYSPLFAPHMMVGVTLTGQLGLLMLIETLTLDKFEVVSANTDGIVAKVPKIREDQFFQHVRDWENKTGFSMERTDYSALYSRDVNSYIAIKTDGEVKAKGAYSSYGLGALQAKCPKCQIVKDAVIAKLSKGIDVTDTIMSCDDIRKFSVAQNVKGGGYWNKQLIGKVVRYYYSSNSPHNIVNQNGGQAQNAMNVVPIMQMPNEIPKDLSKSTYIKMANDILHKDFDSPKYVGDLFDDPF